MFRKLVIAVGLLVVTIGAAASPAVAASHHHTVLGQKHLYEPYGKGWGTAHPETIYNGGDPSGLVRHITWTHWGQAESRGQGLGSQFRPHGGYYDKFVKVQFRAKKLGRCTPHGPRAYTVLVARFQKKPGAAYGHWFKWAGSKTICKAG